MDIWAKVKWTPLGHTVCQEQSLLYNQQTQPCPPSSEFCSLLKVQGHTCKGA